MISVNPYVLLENADEALLDGKKVVFFKREEVPLDDSVEDGATFMDELTVEVEGEIFFRFDNADLVSYGEDTDDGAWLCELDTGKELYLVAHSVSREPVQVQ